MGYRFGIVSFYCHLWARLYVYWWRILPSYTKALTQTNITFSLGFYAIPTIISFYFIVFTGYWVTQGFNLAKDHAFLCTMHFARVYALNLLILTPFIVWSIDLLSTELTSYEEYVGNNLLKVFILTAITVILLFRCLFKPLRRYMLPANNRLLAYLLLMILVYLSLELNQHISSPVSLKFDNVFSCDKAYKSAKYSDLSDFQKQRFIDHCEASDWNKTRGIKEWLGLIANIFWYNGYATDFATSFASGINVV